MNEKIIKLQNVSKFYSTNGVVALGLRGIDLEFSLGEFVIITGASGSGKTTLLNVIAGMDSYQEGKMFFNGEDTSYFGQLDYARYRRDNICFVFQHYNLIESYTVYQNISLAMTIKGLSDRRIKERVKEIIKKVGLDHRANYRVSKLSGGEKQRVAIARALASSAPIIACDEITGNLDSKTSQEILHILKEISKDKLVLLVTHDPEEAIAYASREIRLFDGSIAEDKVINKNVVHYDYEKPEYKNPKIMDIFRVTARMVAQTPKRAIFIVLALLIAFVFISNNYGQFGANMTQFSFRDFSAQLGNPYEERVVLQKNNKGAFTENEIEALRQKNYVDDVIVNDFIIDNDIYVQITDTEYGYTYQTSFRMSPLSLVDPKNITEGRMPENKNEVLAYKGSYMGTELVVNETYEFIYCYRSMPLKVVGIVEDNMALNNNPPIFVTNEFIKSLYAEALIVASNISILADGSGGPSYSLTDHIVSAISDESEYDIIITEYFYGDYAEIEKNPEYSGTFVFENIYMNKSFKNCKILIKSEKFPDKHDIKPMSQDIDVLWFYSDYKIQIKQSIYNEITEFEIYQVSLHVALDKLARAVINLELTADYVVFPVAYTLNDSMDIINVILEMVMSVFAIVTIGVIFIIVYFALRRIMTSSRNDFQILRSLGANNRWIRIQLFIEILIYINIAFIFYIAFIMVMKSLTDSIFLMSFQQLVFMDLVKIYGIVLLLGAFLAIRYYQRLFKLSVVSRELE